MKALVGAFNQEKALVGAFSVIVKSSQIFVSSSSVSFFLSPSRGRENICVDAENISIH